MKDYLVTATHLLLAMFTSQYNGRNPFQSRARFHEILVWGRLKNPTSTQVLVLEFVLEILRIYYSNWRTSLTALGMFILCSEIRRLLQQFPGSNTLISHLVPTLLWMYPNRVLCIFLGTQIQCSNRITVCWTL